MQIKRPARHERQFRRGFRVSPRHSGIDYGWVINDAPSRDILAAAVGIVRSVSNTGKFNWGWGNRIIIDHTDRAYTTYNHNKTLSAKVKKGNKVTTLQVIAEQGNTGDTGKNKEVHLHFELYIDGVRVDPAPYLAGKKLPGEPVITRRTVKVTPTLQINARKSPTTRSDVTRKIASGTVGTFDGYRHGERVTQNGVTSDVWWRAAFGGDWVWSGNMNGSTAPMREVK